MIRKGSNDLDKLVLGYQLNKDSGVLDEICDRSYPIIGQITKQVYRHSKNFDRKEFFQDGCECLISSAVKNYDETKGLSFERYLGFRVKGAIEDGLRRIDHLGRTQRRRITKLREAQGFYETVHGKKRFTIGELIELTGKTRKSILTTLMLDEGRLVSLSRPPLGSNSSLDTVLGFSDDPSAIAIQHEFSEMTYKFMEERLTPNTFEAIHLRYIENMTLREISKLQGITESRISKNVSNGLNELKIFFSGKIGTEPMDGQHSAA
ncbi:sigma-70 family RNA polymerase sigma factor [Candidatus Woesearchaeota archaeon]|jgi:RNA polymerase sigma factor FliA|nr:sigma-70 family RNA polymerase sigma factor [Candidatus Woesearchaeota archaeon]MBT5215195.1 sigma-70 family RNA polymerase sigma factor [Candidatus Woesearchaeota archaeon]MBT6402312.1 sigma-70 family RNA polymerase sigma factor [Candidatus Woesearchaeota archaeon]